MRSPSAPAWSAGIGSWQTHLIREFWDVRAGRRLGIAFSPDEVAADELDNVGSALGQHEQPTSTRYE